MMKDRKSQLLAGLLIGIGILALLTNVGWLGVGVGWLWGFFFAAGGAAFLYFYATERSHWWALIPGFGLLALAAAVWMGDAGGPLFLAVMGVGFAAVYASDRRRWWAIIPAGTLATLALVAWFDQRQPSFDTGFLFLLGIAVTFVALFLLPEEGGKQRWAIYPALGCAALALLTFTSSAVGGVVMPVLLIGAGAYLIWRRDAGRVEPRSRKEA